MRTLIATMVAAALALSPAAALAQETNAANAADTANATVPETDANLTTAIPPTDNNVMATTDLPTGADPAMTADPATPPARDRDGGFPWGLLGLLGLVGLLGRNRSSRP